MSIGSILNEVHNGWKETARRAEAASALRLPCPYCKKLNEWDAESQEARGVFVPYCPGGDCEDIHAATT